MKLSIIVPHHHETQTKMKPLLDSLENQQGVNWDEIEILISHDSKSSPEIDLSKYENLSAHTTQYSVPGLNNVGMNRQNALNHATGELIAFCDADDKLSTPIALHSMLDCAAKDPDYDVWQFRPLFEVIGQPGNYVQTPESNIWMYAKLYRHSFLVDHKIEFTELIQYSEDVYYNMVVYNSGARVKVYSNMFPYVQLANTSSITKKDNGAYNYTRSLPDFLHSIRQAIYALLTHGEPVQKCGFVAAGATMLFYTKYVEIFYKLGKSLKVKNLDDFKVSAEANLKAFIDEFDPKMLYIRANYDSNQAFFETLKQNSYLQAQDMVEDYQTFMERISGIKMPEVKVAKPEDLKNNEKKD